MDGTSPPLEKQQGRKQEDMARDLRTSLCTLESQGVQLIHKDHAWRVRT
jgi:hypothetical protein